MSHSELSKLSNRGVSALDLAWPQPEVMCENGGGTAEIEKGVHSMVSALATMSCHTQLNMFPHDPALGVGALFTEATSCMETLTSS